MYLSDMIRNVIEKLLLSPFSLLYGIGISIRNALYDSELLRASKFNIPVISIGNLSIGGAGKTPHIEYLIRLLGPYLNVATLSRGYKRKTTGFRLVNKNSTALEVGDEPLMYKRKYSDIVVAVGESRALAIPEMVAQHPDIETILLDDAFQHRSVQPALNILLTTFDKPFTRDFLMPSGRLREWKSAYERADIIIVSKCPATLPEETKTALRKEINPLGHQKLFFSYYGYGFPYSFYNPKNRIKLDKELDVILISAIANTSYLMKYLLKEVKKVHQLEYEDHHQFTDRDIEYIDKVYTHRESERKIILTTEKDAMRLDLHRKKLFEEKIPIFILPVHVMFHDDQERFDELIKSFLLNFKS